ncbi:hypothetical protein JCM19238_1298 [Vibrio ponticus]|nr:hypothetical protein JCM19238_1298 [Vibrio ponticus]
MNLNACRIVRNNFQKLDFASVEDALTWLEDNQDVIRVEIDAIDSKSTIYTYTFTSIEESIENLMHL